MYKHGRTLGLSESVSTTMGLWLAVSTCQTSTLCPRSKVGHMNSRLGGTSHTLSSFTSSSQLVTSLRASVQCGPSASNVRAMAVTMASLLYAV
jgi:hypothetical protein